MSHPAVATLAAHLGLGSLLEMLGASYGGYDLLAHWKQGEFHHDVVLRVHARGDLPGEVVLVATNCNGGVKEVLCFDRVPERYSLWHARCPESAEFEGELGIDYKARAAAEEAERRWIARKTFIVWTIALMFFAIACQKLWIMGQDVDVPFSDINPVRSLFGD